MKIKYSSRMNEQNEIKNNMAVLETEVAAVKEKIAEAERSHLPIEYIIELQKKENVLLEKINELQRQKTLLLSKTIDEGNSYILCVKLILISCLLRQRDEGGKRVVNI